MSYRVQFSAKQNSWYIEVDDYSDDYGTSLYDTEQEAYDELAQMVSEGLIDISEVVIEDRSNDPLTREHRSAHAEAVKRCWSN